MNSMRSLTGASLAVLSLSALPNSFQQDPPPIHGFSVAASRIERDWETKFKAIPSPAGHGTGT